MEPEVKQNPKKVRKLRDTQRIKLENKAISTMFAKID